MRGSSTFNSGCLVSGWTWWWTTGCPPLTESSSTVIPRTTMSSGALCWRRPTPSQQPSALFLFVQRICAEQKENISHSKLMRRLCSDWPDAMNPWRGGTPETPWWISAALWVKSSTWRKELSIRTRKSRTSCLRICWRFTIATES